MWKLPFFCTLAILFLGYVLGGYRDAPTSGIIAWLTAFIAALGAPLLCKFGDEANRRARASTPLLLAGSLGMYASFQLTSGPFSEFFRRTDIAVWVLAVIAAALFLGSRGEGLTLRLCRARVFPVLLIGFVIAGLMTIKKDRDPQVDVFQLQQASCDALMHGKNPFTASITDLYGPSSPFYIPLFKNGRSLFGSAYPPLIVLMELPAYALTRDVRYTHLAALLLSALLIAWMRNSWLSLAAAALLLVNPMSLTMVEFGWVEPMAILLLAATLFSCSRYPKAVPALFGLFLASKQTHLAVFPLAPLLITGPWTGKQLVRILVQPLAVVFLVDLPFYFWNPAAFIISLVTLQLKVGIRLDMISYPAYFARRGWWTPPLWFPFLYLPFAYYACLRRLPRTQSGFAFATALLLSGFFALSKQGALNYYFFILGALCCSLALTDCEHEPPLGPTTLSLPTM